MARKNEKLLDRLVKRVQQKIAPVERSALTAAQRYALAELQAYGWRVTSLRRRQKQKSVLVTLDKGLLGVRHEYLTIGERGGLKRVGKKQRLTAAGLSPEPRTKYDPKATYYDWLPGTSLARVLSRWADKGQKVYERSQPAVYTPAELWPHREYTWTRKTSRSGFGGTGEELSGPEKWDALRAELKAKGWNPKDPLQMEFGKNGEMKVGEGNHRLALARSVGLPCVPVQFFFEDSVRKYSQKTAVRMRPKTIKPKPGKPKRKPTAATKATVDKLKDILGW